MTEKDKRQSNDKNTTLRSMDNVYILGVHIVYMLHGSAGWGRTKLQKSLHLIEYCCQIELNSQAIRKTAGPYDLQMMNTLDLKFKQYNHVVKKTIREKSGRLRYNYIPTLKISEVENLFEQYPTNKQSEINMLLSKLKLMDLGRAEIVSTLYAVWNNRIIRSQEITDDLIIEDFYNWSIHKSDFDKYFVLRGLNYMKKEGIVPSGWGRYIDKV